MTKIKTIVCKYPRFQGSRTNVNIIHVITEARVMTKTTAIPIPIAVSIFLETPKKGQMPRNRLRTKLFTRTAPTIIRTYSISPPSA
jgi:hypothetical protein